MKPTAAPFIPEHPTLAALPKALQTCRGCDLYKHATQAVPGEGKNSSGIVLIGEQPGNDEDLAGHPFVGPAGKLLDRALGDARIDRATVYVTNAVKHFKFEERGKRRLHQKPRASEIAACRPWLETEMALLRPAIIVCLGATAAHAVFGPAYRVTQEHGRLVPHPWASQATSTIHPSAILRAPDAAARESSYAQFVADLRVVRHAAAAG